jgi:FkbM family methyltransferase
MKTVDMHYAGRNVALPDLPEYRKFYRKLATGQWEPQTFAVLARNIDASTVYIDIGAWIGVLPFWAAQTAKHVFAIDPDPTCHDILTRLAAGHGSVTIMHGALSSSDRVTINAVDGFGSSETSVLALGQGERLVVPGIGIDEILRRAGPDPLFVKIDIEGYEFALTDEIARLARENVKGLQIALHPQLLEKALHGPWIVRRVQAAYAVWRLGRIFKGFFPRLTLPKYEGLLSYLFTGVLFRIQPNGSDLVFERDVTNMSKETS